MQLKKLRTIKYGKRHPSLKYDNFENMSLTHSFFFLSPWRPSKATCLSSFPQNYNFHCDIRQTGETVYPIPEAKLQQD